jgi:hypothetical protein
MSFLEKLTCLLSHKVQVVSSSTRDYLISHNLCSSRKAFVIGKGSSHGVDAANHFNPDRVDRVQLEGLQLEYGIGPHDTVFVFQGRMVVDKGV